MMRLYVTNENNEKVTLQYDALTRAELAELIGGKKNSCMTTSSILWTM